MGGDCLNTGCVPSKTLIKSAKVAHLLRTSSRFGINNVSYDIDFKNIMQRVHATIQDLAPHDSAERFTRLGVECLQGEARLAGPHSVEVDGKTLTARHIIIATGAQAVVPELPGLRDIPYLTSDTFWRLRTLPRRLLVLGGGAIGCELAQAMARLGSEVHLMEREKFLLPHEDNDVSTCIKSIFEKEGITVHTACKATGFARKGNGLQVHYQYLAGPPAPPQNPRDTRASGHGHAEVHPGPPAPPQNPRDTLPDPRRGEDGDQTDQNARQDADPTRCLEFDQVLLALGRRPRTTGFGLEALGVRLREDQSIWVDAYLRSNVSSLLACGDVTGAFQFTHTASHQAWYAAVNALFGGVRRFRVDYSAIPWATFTDPEVATVGINERQAALQGIPYECTRLPISAADRARTDDETQGFLKVLTVPGKDRILGASIVSERAGELLAEYIAAMKNGYGLNRILGTIHIYPTLSDINKLAAGAWKRAHAPQRLLKFLECYHRWMR